MKKDTKEVERQLKALANKRRLLIVKFLSSQARASVGSIAEEIRLSFKSTSRHLSVLYSAGILDREQTSTTVLYRFAQPFSTITKTILAIL